MTRNLDGDAVTYRIFNQIIESELRLPELPPIVNGSPTIRILAPSVRPVQGRDPQWSRRWYADADKTEVAIAVARIGADYLLSFPTRADFRINGERDRIESFPVNKTSDVTLRHLLLDQVIPRVMGQRGDLVLHASAIEMTNGAGVVFLGNSGWGKSTLASSFYRNGARLVTDDCLLLEERAGRLIAVPSYPGSRLWTDSAAVIFPHRYNFHAVSQNSEKKRLILHDHDESSSEVEVVAVFLLGDPAAPGQAGGINIAKIEGAEAIMAMIRCGFMLDVNDMDATAKQFASAGRIATTRPAVYSLTYPHDFERLADVRHAIGTALSVAQC